MYLNILIMLLFFILCITIVIKYSNILINYVEEKFKVSNKVIK